MNTMKRFLGLLAVCTVLCGGRAAAQGVLAENVASPFPIPMAEGLFRVSSAEPLGKGGFNIRYLTEAYQISVGKVGEGTSFTGHLGLGYGLTNSLDFTASLPLMLDIAGGLAKYGTGDIVTAFKLGFPSRFPSGYYGGLEISATHPYGYKGRQALNVRPYSRSTREISTRVLFDVNREAVGFRLNLGYLLSSSMRTPGVMLGGAVEIGRGQIFTATAEYWQEPGMTGGQTRRALLGAHMNLWWLRLEAGVEKGLSNDLPSVAGVAGLRVHTTIGGKAKKAFGGRTRRLPTAKDVSTAVRVAVVNFSGFEHQKAGESVAARIKTALGRYGHIRVVDVGGGAEFLDPDTALRMAQLSQADVVITGRILRYEMDRTSRPNLPLVVGFPQTQALMEADVRVVDRRENQEVLAAHLSGAGRQGRGVRLFPTSGDNRTDYLNVIEKERVWEEAIQQVVNGLLEEMAQNFTWFPG